MSNTLLQARQALAKQHPGLGRLVTATDGSTTSIIAPNLAGLANADLVQLGAPVYIEDTTDDQAPEGESSYVSSVPGASSMTVTLYPDLTTAVAASDTGEVWHRHLQHIDRVNECISRADNEFCHRWVLTPLTMLLDGDMEKTAYGDWTAGDSATLAKTASSEGWPIRQYLTVTNAANAGYAYQDVQVVADEQFSLVVLCAASAINTHTAKVIAYDQTNSAAITLSGDEGTAETGKALQILRNTFTIPTDCVVLRVELGVDAAADDVLFGWAALTRRNVNEVVLPDRVKDAASVGRVFQAVRTTSDPYEPPNSWALQEIQGVEKLSTRGTGGVTLRFPGTLGDGLYFYEEWQGYPELTADTDTTEAPLKWLVDEAARECYELADRQWNAGNVGRLPPPGAFGRDASPWWPLIQKQAYICKAARADALGKRITLVGR